MFNLYCSELWLNVVLFCIPECSKTMEFYKASLWVIGQKSNAIPQKTKSTKEPYLHEQILTMEIKHELQLPASEKTEKYEYTY